MSTSTVLSMPRTGAIVLSFLAHGALFVSFGGALSASPSDIPSESVTRLSFLQPAPIPEEVEEQPEEPIEEPPKKTEKMKEVVQKEPEKREPPKVEQQAQQVVSASANNIPQIKEGIIRWERERYLSDVMAHIEHNKWYPKIARRMGMEGEVMVRFVLHADGSAQDLHIENGPETLMAAARKTVERSMPLPRPPKKVDCPIECEFRMRFSLSGT
ncbi:energy transducer TonB [Pseudomonadota bacterium]